MTSSTDTADLTAPPPDPAPARARLGWRERWRALPALTRRPGAAPMAARARALVAVVVLATLLLGLVLRLAGLDAPASVLLVLFGTAGVGATAVLTAGRTDALSFTVLSSAAGLALSTAVGFVLAETGLWFPRLAFAAVAATTVALLVRSLRRDLPGRAGTRPALRTPALLVAAVALGGLVLALVDAGARSTLPQPAGLLGTVGPLWYIGCALVVVSLALAVRRQVSPSVPVLAAGTVVIASQALLYGAPTVMAAARHLGLTEYIRVNGGVDASQDIYQAWPGLFAGSAWLVDGTGAHDLLALATWWPVLVTPVTILAVRMLAGRLLSPGRAWVAAAVYALGDAVNSTYFAPQVFGFLLAIVVLALLVAPPADESTGRRRLRTAAAVGLSLAVVVTHQISPFLLGAALLALVAFRLVRPWWVPLIALVPAVGWALIHQRLLARYIDVSAIGSLLGNIAPPEHPDPVAGVAPVTRLVFYVPGAALVVLGLVAVAVVLSRRDRLHLGLAAAALSPLVLAVATNYGQEGIFRIVLFAVPWLGMLVASAHMRSTGLLRGLLVGGFAVMMAVNSYGQSGLDWARILRPGDAQVTAAFEREAPRGATLLSLGTKNATPTRITEDYDAVGYTSRLRVGGMPSEVGEAYDPGADLAYVTQAYSATPAPGGHYLYVSDVIGAYDDRYGLQRDSDFQRLRAAVAGSPDWVEVERSDTATLYRLRTEPVRSGG